ncbi:ABC transporter permease [endosymbiont of unidentified scaly snail isolate Monju]|uniref:ABC transporter permease n=1 Tax=endosymbiont of unidentified scaly snail isolate Monju TaxID=1248727 RepID=UPI0003891F9F|nr:ABC transporter permease [endosymbiont of unidentified scaly snail isolate Monju]BAN69077.1 peptide/nicke ABC transporter permease [endosymbiont of unidentified scaly snail isolate Monju]
MLSRLFDTLLVLLGVVSLVFLLAAVVPGDPVDVMLGEQSSAADREALRAAMGLDRPLAVRWADYLGGLLHADLGQSLLRERPVSTLIAERLPATLALALAAFAVVLVIALPLGLLEVLEQDWMRTARAKGLGARQALWRHALPNALLPVVTLLGLQLGGLLGGAVVTEVVFAWPGIGSLLIEAIHQRDYPLIQGVVLVIAVSYVLLNALTDGLLRALDPRMEPGG